jgi:undecaprenyl-diphosphatase
MNRLMKSCYAGPERTGILFIGRAAVASFRNPGSPRRGAPPPAAGAGGSDFAAGACMRVPSATTLHRPFRLLLAAGLGFLTAFVAWTAFVLSGRTEAFDQSITEWFRDNAAMEGPVRLLMIIATECGGIRGNAVIAVLGAWWMWTHHRRRFAIGWLIIALIGALLVWELKPLFGHERPPPTWRDPIVTQDNESYPSGHATGSLIGYGMLGFVLLQAASTRRMRVVIAAVLVLWVALVGVSRVYLRAHWFSDVIGGYLLALAYVFICLAIYFRRPSAPAT